MDRRSFLARAGVAGLAGAAGCAALGSEEDRSRTTTEPPSFDVTLRPPEDPTVDDPIEFTVEATNHGGAAGSFTGTVELTGPRNRTGSVSVEEVGVDETATQSVGFGVDYAGSYTVRIPGTDASAEVVVRPREATLDEAAGLVEDLRIAVEDARVEPNLVAEGKGPLHLDGAASRLGGVPRLLPATDPGDAPPEHPMTDLPEDADPVLLVVEATVTNEGEEPRTVDPAALATRATVGEPPRFFTDAGRELTEGVTVADAEATLGEPPLAGAEIEPGEQQRGWLLAPVARETVSEGGVQVGIQRDPKTDAQGARADDNGPPETVWQVVPEGGIDLPRFEVVSLSTPDRVPNMTTSEFTLTVENVGEAPGTYRDVLEITGNHEWDPVGRIAGEVEPGVRTGLSGEFYMAYANLQGLNLQRGAVEATEELHRHVADRAQTTCVGAWLELPFPYEDALELTNGTVLRFDNHTYTDGIELTPTSGVSNHFLLVDVLAEMPRRAVGQGLGKQMIPLLNDFAYKENPRWSPTSAFTFGYGNSGMSNTIIEPVEGRLYPPEPPKEPENGTLSGWIALVYSDPDSKYNEEYDILPREKREIRLGTTVKYSAQGWAKYLKVKWSPKFA